MLMPVAFAAAAAMMLCCRRAAAAMPRDVYFSLLRQLLTLIFAADAPALPPLMPLPCFSAVYCQVYACYALMIHDAAFQMEDAFRHDACCQPCRCHLRHFARHARFADVIITRRAAAMMLMLSLR